jgi:DNA-binding transcriptional LysR family regulator
MSSICNLGSKLIAFRCFRQFGFPPYSTYRVLAPADLVHGDSGQLPKRRLSMEKLDNLNDLALFLKIVDAGGFSAAERSTGIPKSRLSRRIAALEGQLGVRLVQRSSHQFHVTEIGERVYRHARAIAEEVDAVHATVSETLAEPSGLIRISSPVLTGQIQLAGWLADFMNLHPKVRISLDLSNRYVDLLAERIDLALRFASMPLNDADVVARPIGQGKMVLVANMALIEKFGTPASLGDLPRFPALAQGSVESVRPWIFSDGKGGRVEYSPQARFVSDNLLALHQAVLRGTGIAQLPFEACKLALQQGALQELLPELAPPASTLYVVYPSRRGVTSAVRALIAYLEQRHAEAN